MLIVNLRNAKLGYKHPFRIGISESYLVMRELTPKKVLAEPSTERGLADLQMVDLEHLRKRSGKHPRYSSEIQTTHVCTLSIYT